MMTEQVTPIMAYILDKVGCHINPRGPLGRHATGRYVCVCGGFEATWQVGNVAGREAANRALDEHLLRVALEAAADFLAEKATTTLTPHFVASTVLRRETSGEAGG